MSEKSMRKLVTTALYKAHAIPVENQCLPGTPDVECMFGWLELKRMEDWPKRATTIVRCDHFEPEQRIFLEDHCDFGGNAYLLLLIEKTREWLLLNGKVAATLLGRCNQQQLRDNSLAIWRGSEMKEKITECLSRLASCRGD